jgi:predicted metalloprotease with PDZ domain
MNWQTWRVHDAADGFVVSYQVFANKPEIHQGQLDAHHAFLNPGTLGLYVDGHKEDWDVALHLALPTGWRVATGLEPDGADGFTARHYEEFIDCPLQLGEFETAVFTQDGVHYEVVYEGATSFSPGALVPSLRRMITACTELWGRPPLTRYVFQYLETGADFLNGLEHRNSTIITGPIADPARWDGLVAITTHEFIHLWNVKRLRPHGLGPFDYTKEAHTTGLWVVEGLTEYYTDLLVLRAGLQQPASYLASVAGHVQELFGMPGRRNMSLEEASWTTWHFGDDRWNGALNYYVKGYLLGVALDLELRGRSDNQLSLDDVMRAAWDTYGATDRPYHPDEICALAESLLGESLDEFWGRYLKGREDFDWDRFLGHAGLKLVEADVAPALQIVPKVVDGGLRLENVLAGGAAQEAGLMIGDVIVAIEGFKATPALLHQLRDHCEPGDEVTVHYFRRDRLHADTVTLGRQAHFAILPLPDASASQQALRADWLAPAGARAGAQVS